MLRAVDVPLPFVNQLFVRSRITNERARVTLTTEDTAATAAATTSNPQQEWQPKKRTKIVRCQNKKQILNDSLPSAECIMCLFCDSCAFDCFASADKKCCYCCYHHPKVSAETSTEHRTQSNNNNDDEKKHANKSAASLVPYNFHLFRFCVPFFAPVAFAQHCSCFHIINFEKRNWIVRARSRSKIFRLNSCDYSFVETMVIVYIPETHLSTEYDSKHFMCAFWLS